MVIQGACLRTPGGRRGDHGEQDCLIVNNKLMYILIIECNKTLNHKSINDPTKGCVAQQERMKKRLESYFGGKISQDWRIIGMVVYEKVKLRNQVLCASCLPYLVHGEAELPAKIAAMEAQLYKKKFSCIFFS